MTSTKKSLPAFIVVITLALTLFAGLLFVLPNSIVAADAQKESQTYAYYYNNLITTDDDGNIVDYVLAKRFYQALEAINKNGDFKKGKVSYPIVDANDIVTPNQIQAWVEDSDLTVPRAFSAARDAFLMDHPELFYVDLYKLTISAARKNGIYSAYIDSGREATVYRDNGFSSEEQVNTAINAFNVAVNEIVSKFNETTKSDYEIAREVALLIAENTDYDFGSYNNQENVSLASQTFTAYGALVENKAVCAGYSAAYKAILDELNIPCIIVSGYSKGKDKNGNDTPGDVGHSWNYVNLKVGSKDNDAARVAESIEQNGNWFAFDPTWTSTTIKMKDFDILDEQEKDFFRNKYMAMDAMTASVQHIPYGVISSSEYDLQYPSLSILTYENALNPNQYNQTLTFEDCKYVSSYDMSTDGNIVFEYISYKGYNATQLLEKTGLRLVNRIVYFKDGKFIESDWMDVVEGVNYGAFQDVTNSSIGPATSFFLNSNLKSSQYAVVKNLTPDKDALFENNELIWKNLYYSDAKKVEEHSVFTSIKFDNRAYGTYTPPPYVVTEKTKPYLGADITIYDSMAESKDSPFMADKNAITITVVYDEPLHKLDESKEIMVNVNATKKKNTLDYCGFAPFSDGKYVHQVDAYTLQFRFKPSLMYEHNREGYIFTFENVGSAKIVHKKVKDENGKETLVETTSDKTPNHLYLVFSRLYYACPKIFGDGRLWVSCCAQPTLVSNTNMADLGFTDENGESTFTEEERSQMMLVVDKIAPEEEKKILDGIDQGDNNIKKSDIKASQTFDISLQMCGNTKVIPDGSYVQIALGFPEGYGPEDEGVTFKIFHRKHVSGDKYIIEEIPCVVTKLGIVATVTSFSPYTVVAVDKDKVTSKTIVASVEGNGGLLAKEDGKIQTVKKNGSYTYTITPKAGYKIYSVKLNGQSVKDRVTSDGKLTINYKEMDINNELDVMFISNESAQRFEELGIVEIDKIVVGYKPASPADKKTNVGLIVGIVFGVVAVLAIAGAVCFIVLKKKKANAN